MKISPSQYYSAVKRDDEFTNSRQGLSIQKFVTQHFQFQYGKVSYQTFSKEYSSAGWIQRKFIALPMALWSILVKTIYHLIKAVFISSKLNAYKAFRDLKCSWGYLASLFHDCYGSYHIQASVFHNECYDIFKPQEINVKLKDNATQSPSSLSEFENQNSSLSNGVSGESIFVDISASEGEDRVIQKIIDSSIEKLAQDQILKKFHFGVGCFVNFSIAAANKAHKIILLDYDPVVVKFNKIARRILKNSLNSTEFKEKLIAACKQDREISQRKFYPKTSNPSLGIDNLTRILNRNDSFLSDDENFKYVKNLAETDNIRILQGSIYNKKLIKKITELTKKESGQFYSLFLSNVYEWDTDTKKRESLLKNVRTLSNDNTMIVEVIPTLNSTWRVNIAYYLDPRSKQMYDPREIRDKELQVI